MNIISLENVSMKYGPRCLFNDVTFGLDDSEKVGLIGLNGSGKSTLLRIIAGGEQPDAGRAVIANERVVSYLPQNPAFDDDQTVLDAVFAGSSEATRLLREYELACQELSSRPTDERLLTRVAALAHQLELTGAWDLEKDARTVLTQLGIRDTSAQMGRLSGGERKRVALAHALVSHPDLLLLDEPTNHLDADTIAWLEQYLGRFSGALLIVTHDRYFLDRVTNRILEIDQNRVRSFAGNYAYYVEKKAEQDAQQAVLAERQEALLRRELAWLRRGAKARSTKQKARVQRAEELQRQPVQSESAELDISIGFSRMGKKILELDRITKSYGDKKLINEFSYTFKRGDRIGVIGPSGAGKTTLLELITGRIEPDDGRVDCGQTIVIGYYDQNKRDLNGSQRVIDYIREAAERIETADGDTITASQMLEKFMFPPAMQYDLISKLSGGEQRRLYLLRVLMDAPNLLILDEPTNDLDIQTLVRLEEYLDSFAGCLIVVSHDRYFLDRTVESIFRFEDGRIAESPGNYSAFLESRDRRTAESADAKANIAKPVANAAAASQTPRKLSFKERREFEELEKRIEAAEARKVELERVLAESSSDFVAVDAAYKELETLNVSLEADVERWAKLAELA
ncbi:MAG: ABC transporter [Blastocatellia bacterium AA13]|nr:MAG: ABC transporter [Blastocatellia bacterium AA13]